MKKIVKLLAILLVILLVILTVLIVKTQLGNEEESYSFYTTDEEVMEIETDYCNLYYPMTWKDQMYISIENKEFYSVQFFALTDNEDDKVALFDINFGGNNGIKIGDLTVGNRETEVFIDSHNFNEDEYTEEEYRKLCGMSEDVNVIISKLIEMYDFKLEQ